jgi:hypothetical protein
VVASHLVVAVPPDSFSLPAWAALAWYVVVPAQCALFPQEQRAGVADARSVEEPATCRQAHSGWVPANCLDVLPAGDLIQADLVRHD